MKKETVNNRDDKLFGIQRILLRAFVVNFIFVLIVWLLSFSSMFMNFVAMVIGVSTPLLYISLIGWLAIWKLAGVVLFLVPALGIWWERSSLRKRQ